MVKQVTIDSSVIISSLLRQEKRHQEACDLWNRVDCWRLVCCHALLNFG